MAVSVSLSGLWPPVATPFGQDGSVDPDRWVALGRLLLSEGARGLVLMGTTGEATSLGLHERHDLIGAVVRRGIEPARLIIGTGACAIGDAAELTRHAMEVGAAAVLLLPPFYFKDIDDDGLFAFTADVIRQSGPNPPRILLYHIPPFTKVGWSFPLIGRLAEAFPAVVIGIKDSSSDEAHTLRLIREFPSLAVFPGSESNLIDAIRAGAAGLITTSGNVNARALAALIANPTASDAAQRLSGANALRVALKARGLFPSVKAVIAARMRDDAWLRLRPPLMRLSQEAHRSLLAEAAIAALLAGVPAPV